MKILKNICFILFGVVMLIGCSKPAEIGSFEYDLEFLKKNKNTILLKSDNDNCQIAIIADYQGRVMTSTSNGLNGKSYGWINYDLIASNKFEEHINVFGGEDRFWLGPEGGQFSIFFKEGSEFDFENWFTPKEIDKEPFTLVESNDSKALFKNNLKLTNYKGFNFNIDVEREISIFNKSEIEKNLKTTLNDNTKYVGFQTANTIENIGEVDWSKEQGLLSIWILGMFNPSEGTTVIIPYRDSLELNTSYFGEVGDDRLQVINNTVLFKGDGKYRSKIGIPPQNAMPFFGSYDSEKEILTIVEYSLSGDTTYVNSLWKHQENPYSGDVINSYNDGPLEDGSQLGPFYELESSSHSEELKTGESMKHIHKTYHFEGEFAELNSISKNVLGFDLYEIK